MHRLIAIGSIALAGCTELIHADFGSAAYVVGSTPAGGLSGSPAGDAVSTLGTVTVTAGNGTGLGKHVFINAGDEDASITFLPTPLQGDHFLLSFRGTKQEPAMALTAIEIHGTNAAFEEAPIAYVGVAGSPTIDPHFWGEIPGSGYVNLDDPHMVWDEPHSVFVRLDNVSRRIFIEAMTELPDGTILRGAGESTYETEFVRISRVVVRAVAHEGTPTDYHLGDLNLSTWTDRQQSEGIDAARRHGLIPMPSGSDTRTTLKDELTLLDEAFAASPSMLRSWLTPTAVRVIEAIRP